MKCSDFPKKWSSPFNCDDGIYPKEQFKIKIVMYKTMEMFQFGSLVIMLPTSHTIEQLFKYVRDRNGPCQQNLVCCYSNINKM